MTKWIRRFFSITSICCLLLFISTTASAQISPSYADTHSGTEVLENGDYIITTISEYDNALSARSANTKTGSKTAEYYNSNDELCWSFKITGTFSYNGSTSSCTKVTSSYKIYNTAWKNPSTSVSKSGNKATGTITIKQYYAGVVISTKTRTLSLSCNKNGTLS